MTTINHSLALAAQRHALGLSCADVAALPHVKQDRKVISAYERMSRTPSHTYIDAMHVTACHYRLLLKLLTQDLELHTRYHDKPPVLPFFREFSDFVETTGNHSKLYWRVWQSVLGHLVLTGSVNLLDDDTMGNLAHVPSAVYWLDGGYSINDDSHDCSNQVRAERALAVEGCEIVGYIASAPTARPVHYNPLQNWVTWVGHDGDSYWVNFGDKCEYATVGDFMSDKIKNGVIKKDI